MQKKIVLIGGPGTGKTSVLKQLKRTGFFCMEEISREITIKAQKEGIDQLFLTEPILFSKLLLQGRKEQYQKASDTKNDLVFFDRGLPDIHAYLDYTKEKYPSYFKESSKEYIKSLYFILDHGKKFSKLIAKGMKAMKRLKL